MSRGFGDFPTRTRDPHPPPPPRVGRLRLAAGACTRPLWKKEWIPSSYSLRAVFIVPYAPRSFGALGLSGLSAAVSGNHPFRDMTRRRMCKKTQKVLI